MRLVRTALAVIVPVTLALSACGSGDGMAPVGSGSTTDGSTTDGSTAAEESMGAAWQSLVLTDVDGNAFTFNELMGRPVFVENFATWCPTCRRQLGVTQEAAAELGDDAVFIALSVETDLSSADVAQYAADNGFDDIRFAVMTPEYLAAISDHYGNSTINAPSTPHYIIDSHGVAGELMLGQVDAQEIVRAMHAAAM